MSSDPQDRIYPCDECGKLRTKAEGGTTFTVCDACWDATKADPQDRKYPGGQAHITAEGAEECRRQGDAAAERLREQLKPGQDRRELLPCPFCGGPATLAPYTDTDPTPTWPGCQACDVWLDDEAEWNRRQPSEGREPTTFGFRIRLDATMPRNAVDFRSADGAIVGRIDFGAAPTLEPDDE
jgi:hypothetical protein